MKIKITVNKIDDPIWRYRACADFRDIVLPSDDEARAINYVKGAVLCCIGESFDVLPDVIEFEIVRATREEQER
jgi:hypothetical protein